MADHCAVCACDFPEYDNPSSNRLWSAFFVVLKTLLVLLIGTTIAISAFLAGYGKGIDWQRGLDHKQICRAYPNPAATTGFTCP